MAPRCEVREKYRKIVGKEHFSDHVSYVVLAQKMLTPMKGHTQRLADLLR